jgi:hypothetical protein
LRLIAGELQMADVRSQVILSLFTDFVNMNELKPDIHHETSVVSLFDQVIAWSNALKTLRK